jgi:hypothetical protein
MTRFTLWQLYIRVKSPQSVPTKSEAGYKPERAYTISNTELPPIPAETEVRLRLFFGQEACQFTAIAAVFILGRHMGICKSDVFKCNLNNKRNIIYLFK